MNEAQEMVVARLRATVSREWMALVVAKAKLDTLRQAHEAAMLGLAMSTDENSWVWEEVVDGLWSEIDAQESVVACAKLRRNSAVEEYHAAKYAD